MKDAEAYDEFIKEYENLFGVRLEKSMIKRSISTAGLSNKIKIVTALKRNKNYESNPVRSGELFKKLKLSYTQLRNAVDPGASLSLRVAGIVVVEEIKRRNGLSLYLFHLQSEQIAKDYLALTKKYL